MLWTAQSVITDGSPPPWPNVFTPLELGPNPAQTSQSDPLNIEFNSVGSKGDRRMGRSKIYGVASAAVGAGSVGPAATKSVIPSTANELPGTKSSGKPRKIHTAKAQAATRPLDPPLSPPPSSPLGFDNPHEGEICGFDASPDSPVASEATLAASEPGSPPPISVIVSKAASGSIKKKSRSKDRKGKENENVIVVDVKLEAIKEVR